MALEPVKQKAGKIVQAWAFADDCDPNQIRSNSFSIEWSPGAGKQKEFPEVDRAAFFEIEEANQRINPAQVALLSELQAGQLRSPVEDLG
jgi:predicted NUDIX family NTP pyrophosphohydrolase